MNIVNTPKQQADLDKLLQEVNASPFIGQLTRHEVEKYIENQTIRFYYDDGDLLGFGAWEDIDDGWCEIGPFYAMEAHRGKGIGKTIIASLLMFNSTKKLYAVTKNPLVKTLFEKFRFRQVKLAELPRVIRWHLLKKVSPQRVINLMRKLSADDEVFHYIRED